MSNLNDKLSLFDAKQFDEDNGELAELMKGQLVTQIGTAITGGKDLFELLYKSYKEYYQMNFNMDPAFQKEYKRQAHTFKGQAKLCYVNKMSDMMAHLQKAIETSNKSEIDKYTYETFSFKKRYFECLFAIKGENVEEPEFDLRQFDDFTHLSFAPIYQSIPINSKSLTFNQNGSQSIINNMDVMGIGNQQRKNSSEQKKNRVLVSENVTEKVEIIKPKQEKVAPLQNGEEEQGNLVVVGDIKVNDTPESLYQFAKMPRELGSQLFILRRPQISHEDLPIDSQLTCSIF